MGGSQSTPLETCLNAVCGSRSSCVGYPSDVLYQIEWVKPYNLDDPVTPVAVIRPDTAQDVSGIVKCATANSYKVQAKSGGHSYANFGLGGENGEIAVDLVNMKNFSMDTNTWYASLGSGSLLGEIDPQLIANGNRAAPHGVCPGVGIGGHATVGGIGPMSRMWGTLLDQVVEIEIVTADGAIQRASTTENEDLFWAVRGAGASFGIVTEFVIKTYPAPGSVVQSSFSFSFGSQSEMAPVFKTWQALAFDPTVDDRFQTQFIAEPLGATITGTFYGTEAEFHATGIPNKIPAGGDVALNVTDWLGHLAQAATQEALYLSNIPTEFYSKSLALAEADTMDDSSIDGLFNYMGSDDIGTLIWFIIWDQEGGVINSIPDNSSAYSHRDTLVMYQSYSVGLPTLSNATVEFIEEVDNRIRAAAPSANGSYAGYVDPRLSHDDAVAQYWGAKLPQLTQIKGKWDPNDVFHNPQSVEPLASEN